MYSLLQLPDTSKPPTASEHPATPGLLLRSTLWAPPPALLLLCEAQKSWAHAPNGLSCLAADTLLPHNARPRIHRNHSLPPVSCIPTLLLQLSHQFCDIVRQMGEAVIAERIWSHKVNNGLIPLCKWQPLITANHVWGISVYQQIKVAKPLVVRPHWLNTWVNPQSHAFSKYFELTSKSHWVQWGAELR